MKNILLCILSITLLGCVDMSTEQQISTEPETEIIPEPTPEEQAEQIETDLLATNEIIPVLEFYESVHWSKNTETKAICHSDTYNNIDIENILLEKSTIGSANNKKCLLAHYCYDTIDYVDTSDECILTRRSLKPSKINYFNYKKYIKNHAGLKTEDDFIYLHKMYKAIELYKRDSYLLYESFVSAHGLRGCFSKTELTSTEIKQCEQDKENFLSDMASGKAKKCSVKYPKQYKKVNSYDSIKFGAINLCVPDNISNYQPMSW